MGNVWDLDGTATLFEISNDSMRLISPAEPRTSPSRMAAICRRSCCDFRKRDSCDSRALRVANSTRSTPLPRCGTRRLTRRPACEDSHSASSSPTPMETARAETCRVGKARFSAS